MPERDKIVAVGLFTQLEYDRWGDKLRAIYHVDQAGPFDELLRAIDDADEASKRSKLETSG
jgi:hypothetical protein